MYIYIHYSVKSQFFYQQALEEEYISNNVAAASLVDVDNGLGDGSLKNVMGWLPQVHQNLNFTDYSDVGFLPYYGYFNSIFRTWSVWIDWPIPSTFLLLSDVVYVHICGKVWCLVNFTLRSNDQQAQTSDVVIDMLSPTSILMHAQSHSSPGEGLNMDDFGQPIDINTNPWSPLPPPGTWSINISPFDLTKS